MKALLAAALAALALPALARAGDATLVARDVPLARGRALAAAQAAPRFDLVGLHWQGAGTVLFRTRSLSGRWSGWRPAAPEAEDRPDRGSREAASQRGWRLGNPYWTGPSNRIEYRLVGRVSRLRAYFVWSPVERRPLRTMSLAGSPAIVPRPGWSADESILRAAPAYAPAIRFAVVHHTAGSNGYGPLQSAAIVRGIELYHVKGNGWNDIGYNFLVDRYGQVFEGRSGGVDRNVVGAHAEGFNGGSVGVAVIGTYGSARISSQARRALVRLLAWRLDVAHLDPLSTLSWISGGNQRFPAGVPVFLRAISGHRDTGFTACPGNALYAQLNAVAGAVGATGLPKLYEPSARGSPGGLVRFSARLSSALPWSVTVTDDFGQSVARGSGNGAAIAWTWDASAALPGRYSYAIEAGPSVRPATGTLGLPPALALTGVAAVPGTITPNGDGLDDSTTVIYTLSAPATVTVTVVDEAGTTVATLFSARRQAGTQSFGWSADGIADGRYRLVISARAPPAAEATAAAEVIVDRLLLGFSADPALFSPNGDGRLDTIRFSFVLPFPAQVTLAVLQGAAEVATIFSGPLEAGLQQITWDGATPAGALPDGSYRAVLTVTGTAGSASQSVPFASDTTAPTLELLSLAGLRFWLSEPATVVLAVDGKRVVKVEPAGVFHVPYRGATSVEAVAWDGAGNVSTAVAAP